MGLLALRRLMVSVTNIITLERTFSIWVLKNYCPLSSLLECHCVENETTVCVADGGVGNWGLDRHDQCGELVT